MHVAIVIAANSLQPAVSARSVSQHEMREGFSRLRGVNIGKRCGFLCIIALAASKDTSVPASCMSAIHASFDAHLASRPIALVAAMLLRRLVEKNDANIRAVAMSGCMSLVDAALQVRRCRHSVCPPLSNAAMTAINLDY